MLPLDVLDRRNCLPEKPASFSLEGESVYIEPLDVARDGQALFEMSNGTPITLNDRSITSYDADELVWRYMLDGPFDSRTDFEASLQPYINAPDRLCMCIFDRASKRQVGVIIFINNKPEHLKIELAGIWYSPIVQRTRANTETIYLMLKHAFELGYRRLEWKCDALNERSRRAALRLGFQFEGIHESHMIVKGHNRDTAWFRILESEWPDVKKNLEHLLSKY